MSSIFVTFHIFQVLKICQVFVEEETFKKYRMG